jgi:hypothetical protein
LLYDLGEGAREPMTSETRSSIPVKPPNSASSADEVRLLLRYAGRDVDEGAIDVEDLLAALNGFSSAFYRLSDRESQEFKQRIRVTGISRSSANVHLEIFQLAHSHPVFTSTLVGGAGYVGKKIADLVIEKIAAVAKAKKHIQNAAYTTEISVNGDNNQVIIVNGVNARLPVDRDVLELIQEGTIDTELDKMTSPLREDSIDVFEIKREDDAEADLHLDASDRPYFSRTKREATTTAELTMFGSMNTISKATNSGIFIAENGRRIRYRFTNENRLPELYRQFAHLGPVKITCTAKLDENLDVISIDISNVEPIQERLRFAI